MKIDPLDEALLEAELASPTSPLGYELLNLVFFVAVYGAFSLGCNQLGLSENDPMRVRALFTTFVCSNLLATYIAVSGLKLIPTRGLVYDVALMITLGLVLCSIGNAGDLLLWFLGIAPLKSLPFPNALFLGAIFLGAFGIAKLARLCHVKVSGVSALVYLGFCGCFFGFIARNNPDFFSPALLAMANPREAVFGLLYAAGSTLVAVLALQIGLEVHGQLRQAARVISVGTIVLSLGCAIYGILFTKYDAMTVAANPVHLILGIAYLCLGLGVFRLGQTTLEIFSPDFTAIPPSQPLTEMFGQSLGMKVYEAMSERIRHSQEALGKAEIEKRVREEFIASLELEIAARRKTEEDLRQSKETAETANQAKSQFLAMMSHELKTPLATIRGYSQLLADRKSVYETFSADEKRDMAKRIVQGALRLQEMIESILHFSKGEARGIQVRCEPFDLSVVLEYVQEYAERMAKETGVIFILEKPGYSVRLKSDSQALTIILCNLVGNALKFTSVGEVRLKVTCKYPTLACEVSDTGVGIPADQVEKVFEPFYQFSSGITRKFGGVGLGLSIARKYLNELHGRISVTSELNKGTRVSVELPETVLREPGVN